MTKKAPEIITRFLSIEQLHEELAFIDAFFQKHANEATYMHGWASNAPDEKWWIEHPIPTTRIQETVHSEIESGRLLSPRGGGALGKVQFRGSARPTPRSHSRANVITL